MDIKNLLYKNEIYNFLCQKGYIEVPTEFKHEIYFTKVINNNEILINIRNTRFIPINRRKYITIPIIRRPKDKSKEASEIIWSTLLDIARCISIIEDERTKDKFYDLWIFDSNEKNEIEIELITTLLNNLVIPYIEDSNSKGIINKSRKD